jgi:hypothetical protein
VGPDHLAFSTPPPASTPAGTAFTVRVQVRDGADALVTTGPSLSVTLTLTTNPCGAVFAPMSQGTVAGVATFNITMTRACTGYQLTGTSGSLTTGLSNTFDITALGPHHLGFVTSPFAVTIGTTSPPIVVQLQDQYNNGVTNGASKTIFLATSSKGGSFRDATTPTTVITQITMGTSANCTTVLSGLTNVQPNASRLGTCVTFKYIDSKNGSPTIRAKDQSGTTDTGLPDAVQSESITKLPRLPQ